MFGTIKKTSKLIAAAHCKLAIYTYVWVESLSIHLDSIWTKFLFNPESCYLLMLGVCFFAWSLIIKYHGRVIRPNYPKLSAQVRKNAVNSLVRSSAQRRTCTFNAGESAIGAEHRRGHPNKTDLQRSRYGENEHG